MRVAVSNGGARSVENLTSGFFLTHTRVFQTRLAPIDTPLQKLVRDTQAKYDKNERSESERVGEVSEVGEVKWVKWVK